MQSGDHQTERQDQPIINSDKEPEEGKKLGESRTNIHIKTSPCVKDRIENCFSRKGY